VVSGLQARHVLGVAAWEVEPLEGLAPPHLQVSDRVLSSVPASCTGSGTGEAGGEGPTWPRPTCR
jgi:hypothetical protein